MLSLLVGRATRRYLLLNRADCADVLQETRIALWKLGAGRQVSAAWVVRVAVNKTVDLLRQHVRDQRQEREYAYLTVRNSADPELPLVLHADIEALPGKMQDFHRLHYLEGWSERELAHHLDMCRASVRWIDEGCRTRLRGRVRRSASEEENRTSPGENRLPLLRPGRDST